MSIPSLTKRDRPAARGAASSQLPSPLYGLTIVSLAVFFMGLIVWRVPIEAYVVVSEVGRRAVTDGTANPPPTDLASETWDSQQMASIRQALADAIRYADARIANMQPDRSMHSDRRADSVGGQSTRRFCPPTAGLRPQHLDFVCRTEPRLVPGPGREPHSRLSGGGPDNHRTPIDGDCGNCGMLAGASNRRDITNARRGMRWKKRWMSSWRSTESLRVLTRMAVFLRRSWRPVAATRTRSLLASQTLSGCTCKKSWRI